MLRFDSQDGLISIVTEIKDRYAVYLDNDSIIELAKHDEARRKRFIAAIKRGGCLLFSMANAVEIGGPQGASATSVMRFLDSLGAHWAPLELNPWRVIEKEAAGCGQLAPISQSFIRAYFAERTYELSPEGRVLLDVSSESFFSLGRIADWSRQNRSALKDSVDEMYCEFVQQLGRARLAYERDASLQSMPTEPFDPSRPATFATRNLLRLLVAEWKAYRFTRNDVMDFCHAVLGTSTATLATLDKQWKRRVGRVPQPNGLAKVFYKEELDHLVGQLETLVQKL